MIKIDTEHFEYTVKNQLKGIFLKKISKPTFINLLNPMIELIKKTFRIDIINLSIDIPLEISKEITFAKMYGLEVNLINDSQPEQNVFVFYQQSTQMKFTLVNDYFYRKIDKKLTFDDFDNLYFFVEDPQNVIKICENGYPIFSINDILNFDQEKVLLTDHFIEQGIIGIINHEVYLSIDQGNTFLPSSIDLFDHLYEESQVETDYLLSNNQILQITNHMVFEKTITCDTFDIYISNYDLIAKKNHFTDANNCRVIQYSINLVPPYLKDEYKAVRDETNIFDYQNFLEEKEQQIKENQVWFEVGNLQELTILEVLDKLSHAYINLVTEILSIKEKNEKHHIENIISRLLEIKDPYYEPPSILFNGTEQLQRIERFIIYNYQMYLKYLSLTNSKYPELPVGMIYTNGTEEVIVIQYKEEIEKALLFAKKNHLRIFVRQS